MSITCAGDSDTLPFQSLPCIFGGNSISVASPQPTPTGGFGHAFIYLYPDQGIGLGSLNTISFDLNAQALSLVGTGTNVTAGVEVQLISGSTLVGLPQTVFLNSSPEHMIFDVTGIFEVNGINASASGYGLSFKILQLVEGMDVTIPELTVSNIVLTYSGIDLSVAKLTLTKPDGSPLGVSPTGLTLISPDSPFFLAAVKVSGTGFDASDTRIATVTLQVGQQLLTSSLPLAWIAGGGGSSMVYFETQLPAGVTSGLLPIVATVSPGNPFGEANFSNNTASTEVQVVGSSFDLAISPPVITKPDGSPLGVSPTGQTLIPPDAPFFLAAVKVNGTGFDTNDTRIATVTLQVGQQLLTSSLPLAWIAGSGGNSTVYFEAHLSPGAIGIQTITAIVDPGNVLQEADSSNNTASTQVQVVAPYKLVASVNGVQVPDGSGLKYPLAPSNIRAFGDGVVPGLSTPVVVSCIDTTTGNAATGCYFQLHMDRDTSAGASDGGHKHRGGTFGRQPFEFNETDQTFPLDTPMSVDQDGKALFYTPPEAAGDLVLTIKGWSDSSRSTSLDPVAPITFQIGVNGLTALPASNVYRLTGVYPNTSINPNSQYHPGNHYLSADGLKILDLVASMFTTFQATLGVNDASLEKGGVFDLGLNWQSPHGLHRLGNGVDVDLCAESTIDNNPFETATDGCPNAWIRVPQDRFLKLCKELGGFKVPEPQLHCEFSVNPEDL